MCWGIPGGLGLGFGAFSAGAQVLSLLRELRSHVSFSGITHNEWVGRRIVLRHSCTIKKIST